MNYIELINQFWKQQHVKAFTAGEAYLYFCLLNECNVRHWQNPFECSNRAITAATGISERNLIDVRNRLKQKGLIDFEPGKRKARSPVYTILYSNEVSKTDCKTISKTNGKTDHLNIKTKTETKQREENEERLPLAQCSEQLFADTQYCEILAQNNGLTSACVEEYMLHFFKKLQNEAVQHKSPADAKSHFARWLAIQLKENERNTTNHTASADTSSAKDYATT